MYGFTTHDIGDVLYYVAAQKGQSTKWYIDLRVWRPAP